MISAPRKALEAAAASAVDRPPRRVPLGPRRCSIQRPRSLTLSRRGARGCGVRVAHYLTWSEGPDAFYDDEYTYIYIIIYDE